MKSNMVLILGGVRSGKSAYANQIAKKKNKPVLYVATATAGDEEMALRIDQHKKDRPENWITLEAPLSIGKGIQATGFCKGVILVDCITMLVSNLLMQLPENSGEEIIEKSILAEFNDLYEIYHSIDAEWIIVSNEVGLGLVPPYPLGRAYRDALGRMNQHLASLADEVLFMIAGIPMKIK